MASVQTLSKEIERLEKENTELKIRTERFIQQVQYVLNAISIMQHSDNHFKNVILEDMEKHIKEY